VPDEAWQQVAANAIARLGKDREGVFGAQRFISDYGNLSDAGKKMLFHGVDAGNLIKHLDDISEVSRKFVQAGKLAAPSGRPHVAGTMTLGGIALTGIMHAS
jgi:hypothetical protein